MRTPTAENPLLHAGRALFAANNGDEAGVERELTALLAHDRDGRHRRWALAEVVFAPFSGCGWFAALCAPPAPAGVARARPVRA
jgi:hypothetical protein